MGNLVLPRRAFLKGLVALIPAPAIDKAESLMPISVWRPRLEVWRTRAFCQDWLVVHQFDLDNFHAGRFDVSLLPDWVRKSPCVFTDGRAVGLSCSARLLQAFSVRLDQWLERHRPAAWGEATRAAETTTDGVISRIIDAGERGERPRRVGGPPRASRGPRNTDDDVRLALALPRIGFSHNFLVDTIVTKKDCARTRLRVERTA